MTIDRKLRSLRKKRNTTQEQLAEALGVSPQTVSKWENGISSPDISLLPAIAHYFNITLDDLFDFNLKETEKRIEDICDAAVSYRDTDPVKAKAILEDGLKLYPDNDVLLNNLLYVLDCENDPDKVISTALKTIDVTTHDEIRFDALRCLAGAYSEKNDCVSALAALERIPEIYFSKLSATAWIMKGNEKYEAAVKQKWIAFEDTVSMMRIISSCLEAQGSISEAKAESERVLKLIEIMNNDRLDPIKDDIAKAIARLSAELPRKS